MNPPYAGTLELTWTNKHLALLSHEGGGYEWVEPTDHRVSEVRLLQDAGTVGETYADHSRRRDNLLIRGDALNALTSLAKLPEFAKEYKGKVKLCYIDPPFNTGQAFEHYDDNLEHSVWLTMMRDRLLQIKELLAPDGSVWVHLDDRESHRARLLLDEVFGAESFVATIIWQKTYTRENRTDISISHEYIHVYAQTKSAWKEVRNVLPASEAQIARYTNPDDDPRGPWKATPVHAKAEKGRRRSQYYTITSPSGVRHDPPPGRCWLYTESRYREMVDDDRIWFGTDGEGVPTLKKFLSEVQQGLVPVSIWPHEEVGTTGSAKAEIVALFPGSTPFSTPKPEHLMERIIHIATDPGDIVLDCFAGSGTTAAVAHKMGRRWVAAEWSEDTLASFTIPRLTKVIKGADPGGITESIEWTGGGGFRILDVAPSMFTVEDGVIYLADWAADNALAEPAAAQLGFDFEPDGPFSGHKGRTRLAVVDGIVSVGLIDVLLQSIDQEETVVICATAVAPDARQHLRALSRGSRIRKIPDSIVAEYRIDYRRRRALELRLATAVAEESSND